MLVPPFGLSTVLRGVYEGLFPVGGILGEPVDRTSGILKSWSLGLGPERVGRGSSSSSTSCFEAAAFLALCNRHTTIANATKRINNSDARQPMTILRRVSCSALGRGVAWRHSKRLCSRIIWLVFTGILRYSNTSGQQKTCNLFYNIAAKWN